MNLRFVKQRTSHSQASIKKNDNSVDQSHFFSRPSHQLSDRNKILYDQMQKQNQHPNIKLEYNHPSSRLNQNSLKLTPKKKVIHLKSTNRKDKSIKDGNSGSLDKKNYVQHNYTQVADFTDSLSQNRPSITIDIDLKSHRRSMQDTLMSSNANNELTKVMSMSCCSHINKKATFIIKGKPYCDKCSVKFITKGHIAIRIKQQKDNGHYVQEQQNEHNEREKRDEDLRNFIEQLDKIQPTIEQLGRKLQSYTSWLNQYCIYEYQKFEQSWDQMMVLLQKFKEHIIKNFKAQEQRANKVLQQNKIKIKQQTQNMAFMRNDIVRNIDRIVDENIICQQNYMQVMTNFKLQLQQINQNVLQVRKTYLLLPKSQLDIYEFDKNVHKFFVLKSVPQQLFVNSRLQTPPVLSERINEQEDYRLSFGKQTQKLQSPTFKLI